MLVWDKTVSEDSPIVQGTWVSAVFVQRLVKGGDSIPGIMRCFPELTVWDVFECLNLPA